MSIKIGKIASILLFSNHCLFLNSLEIGTLAGPVKQIPLLALSFSAMSSDNCKLFNDLVGHTLNLELHAAAI